jgi:hypothetical protein
MQMAGERLDVLRELGESLNYYAYGETDADVMLHPAALYRIVSHYADPFELHAREPVVAHLAQECQADLRHALGLRPLRSSPACDAYMLPDAAWSRRVSGTFANRLAQLDPGRAHAVLTPLAGGAYVVSVRGPRGNAFSAADFCRRFPGGGGRRAAGGINRLEAAGVDSFLHELSHAFAGEPG